VDHHRNSIHPVAARLPRREHKSKIPENGQLDSHPDCHRRHTRHLEPPWGDVNFSRFDDQTGAVEAVNGFILRNGNSFCHPVFMPGGLDCWMVFSPSKPDNLRGTGP